MLQHRLRSCRSRKPFSHYSQNSLPSSGPCLYELRKPPTIFVRTRGSGITRTQSCSSPHGISIHRLAFDVGRCSAVNIETTACSKRERRLQVPQIIQQKHDDGNPTARYLIARPRVSSNNLRASALSFTYHEDSDLGSVRLST